MNPLGPKVWRLAGVGLFRAWLAYSLLGILGTVFFIIIDHDHPLKSDDPWIVGCIFGGIAACATVPYTATELFRKDGPVKHAVYALALCVWCLLLWVGELQASEGAGILAFFSWASLIAGAITWPLLRLKLPLTIWVGISLGGGLVFGMYVLMYLCQFRW